MVSSRDASEHASKKVQEKGTATLFNATAPSLIWSAFGKSEEIDDGKLSPEVPSSIFMMQNVD